MRRSRRRSSTLSGSSTPPSSSAPRHSRSSVAARGASGHRISWSSTSAAGSTDLALVRVELREAPFDDRDQGAGGRYYVISPKLLGSSGNENLGGDLITLMLFRYLKLALADYLLRHAGRGLNPQADTQHPALDSGAGPRPDPIRDQIPFLNLAFKGKDGYLAGSLLEAFEPERTPDRNVPRGLELGGVYRAHPVPAWSRDVAGCSTRSGPSRRMSSAISSGEKPDRPAGLSSDIRLCTRRGKCRS